MAGGALMPSGSPEWPEARTLRLRALWDEGKSISAIGEELGVTRNSVIGKKNRLVAAGYPLAPRHDPIIRDGVAKRPYQRKPYLRPKQLPLAPLASLVTVVAETRIPTPAPALALTHVVVKPRPRETPLPVRALGRCQFLNGTRPLSFCDKPCVRNQRGLPSAYCAHHYALCCIRVRDRREEAA